jgi:hypothetical protein
MADGIIKSAGVVPSKYDSKSSVEFELELTDRANRILMNPSEPFMPIGVAYIFLDKLNKILGPSSEQLMHKIPRVFHVDNRVHNQYILFSATNAPDRVQFIRDNNNNKVKFSTTTDFNTYDHPITKDVISLALSLIKKVIVDSVNEIERHTPESMKSFIANIPVDKYDKVVIPKGTILFRGIHKLNDLTQVYLGRWNERKENFCLGISNVSYFYPYPFVANVVAKYKHIVLFVTTRDITLTSQMTSTGDSYWKHGKSVIGGDNVNGCHHNFHDAGGEDYKDYQYYPIVNYNLVSNDVTGNVGIHGECGRNLLNSKSAYAPYFNKYFTTFVDSSGTIGLPELVLHPRQIPPLPRPSEIIENLYYRRYQKVFDKLEEIDDFKTWYKQNKADFNYIYLHVMENDFSKIKDLMDDFMSEGGLDLGDEEPYHLKMNKKNGLFQIVEFSNNHADLIAPDFSVQTTDFIRKDIYPLSTGSSRASRPLRCRTLRRRRLLKSR